MAFPSTPLPIVVGIAPGANPVSPTDWNFTDISDDIRAAGGVQIQVGRQDESDDVDATQVRAVVDNRSGNYTRLNPSGAYYGQLAKGTPISVAVTRINDTFTRSGALGTDTDSGLTWTTVALTWATTGSAATSALSSANTFNQATVDAGGHDVEVTHTSSLSAVTTGAQWRDATIVRRVDDSNFYRLYTEFMPGGVINCRINRVIGGISTNLTDSIDAGVSYSAGTVIKTRVRAVGARLQIRAWLNSGTEPTTWTCEVDDDELTGTGVGLYEWRTNGNTNAGTLTCTIDNFRSDVIRAITPVPEWPVRWDQSGRDVTAPIAGAGILRRLSQGQSALRSPMYRQLPLWLPAGFWPLEDGSDSTAASSAVPRVPAGICNDVTFGADSPPGAAGAIQLNNTASTVVCRIPNSPDTVDGYTFMVMFKQSAAVVADATICLLDATGTVTKWQLVTAAGGAGVKFNGFDSSGAAVVSTGAAGWGTVDPTRWTAIRLMVTVSGGTVTWEAAWNNATNPIFTGTSGSYSGSANKLTGATLTGLAGMSYSMLWLGANNLPFVNYAFYNVESGFAGELAGDRLARLCEEEGIPLTVIGDTANTTPMGVQLPATLLDLLRECEDADQGVLHERGAGLGYLTRVARYVAPGSSPTMTLDFASGHIAAPPEPTDDDQRVRNQIKLRRPAGVGEVTAESENSIAASGVYSDDLSVNVGADILLDYHAYWRLHLGTFDGLRWPRITLNLARNPSLIAAWLKMRIGSRLTIANPPSAVAGASLDLIVEGWTETLTDYGWDVDLACSPASLWRVGVYDSASSPADSTSTTLGASRDATQTSWTFSTVDVKEVWSTTGTPYDVGILGERVTVTLMGAASGSGPYTQTATVTRSVNGVVKAHAFGEAITLYTTNYYGV